MSVEVVPGARLRVQRFGPSTAAPVLFIHAFPLSGEMWRECVRFLAGSVQAIVPDLRGLGQSVTPGAMLVGTSMSTHASDMAGVLAACGVPRVIVCGSSMGGMIAMEMSRLYPQRVAGLILCDTRATPETDEGKVTRESRATLAETQGANAVAELMIGNVLAKSASPALRAEVLAMMNASDVAGVAAASRALASRPDARPHLASVKVPVLAVCGAEDAGTTPDDMRAMAAGIPGAKFEVIAGAGHLPPLERPEAFAKVVGAWLAGVG
jgi:pimeloyl-ACP methyl ester carboxylesterase